MQITKNVRAEVEGSTITVATDEAATLTCDLETLGNHVVIDDGFIGLQDDMLRIPFTSDEMRTFVRFVKEKTGVRNIYRPNKGNGQSNPR